MSSSKKNKGSGAHPTKETPLPPADSCPKAMQRKYYTMRRLSFQAVGKTKRKKVVGLR